MRVDKPSQKTNPLVSIVVPVYNIERRLDECVNSLIGQTYGNLEIILVDDGSSDASLSKCDTWAKRDSRIRVIHQANEGPAAARNNGLNAASGDFVAFVDGDDSCAASFIETLLKPFDAYSLDVCFCSYDRIDADGNSHDSRTIPEINNGNLEKLLTLILNDDLFPAPWAKLFAADCAKKIHFDEASRIGEDVLMWNRLFNELDALSFCTVNEPLYHYRDSDSSIVRSYHAERERDIVKSWGTLCNTALSRFGSSIEPLVKFRRAWMWFEVLDRAIFYGEADKHDYCDEAVRYLQSHATDIYESNIFTTGRKIGMHILSLSKPLYIAFREKTKKRV